MPIFHLQWVRLQGKLPPCTLSRKAQHSARVAELVDALDLGSSGATHGSSSLPSRTSNNAFQDIPWIGYFSRLFGLSCISLFKHPPLCAYPYNFLKFIGYLTLILSILDWTLIFHKLVSRDRKEERATGSTIAECGLKILPKAHANYRTSSKIWTVKFHVINVVKSPRSEILNPKLKPNHS